MIRRILLAALLVASRSRPGPAGPGRSRTTNGRSQTSDLPPDPAYRFGRLDNGMRYVIRPNATPEGTAMVQFWVDAGSVAETDDERGYAHFIEHMAFNGSTRVPEGEMIRLLEREGLAFGADTNASTSFDVTLYMLDLPRNDPGAARHRADADARDRQRADLQPRGGRAREGRGAVRAARARHLSSCATTLDSVAFLYPGARFAERLPIGTVETLQRRHRRQAARALPARSTAPRTPR